MLGMFQVCTAVLGWIIIAVLSMSPGVRRYRARLLGAVAGGAIGGFAGALGVYVVTVGLLFLNTETQLFSGASTAEAVPTMFLWFSLAAYVAGVVVGARALWRVGSS
jgi:hypothetical protein